MPLKLPMLASSLSSLLAPILAFRWQYLPLMLVYFAYGAMGMTAIAESFWVKEQLDISAEAYAFIGVWLSLPWTVKMLFGQCADSLPIFGSNRRSYIIIGALCSASGLWLMSQLMQQQLTFMAETHIYLLANLLITLGLVIQDVVADAMTAQVVKRTGRPQEQIDQVTAPNYHAAGC